MTRWPNHVVGFMFSPDGKKVVLIRKQKPSWQKGKLNGVGGKMGDVDPYELNSEAMAREFKEETGVETRPNDWIFFGNVEYPGTNLQVFYCKSEKYSEVRTVEEEEVGIYDVDNLDVMEIIKNLRWMIPMCLDKDIGNFQNIKGL